jgi:hypothetical protein
MHSIIQNLEVKNLRCIKDKRLKNLSDMFRILCDPSSGSTELCLTEITRSDSQTFYRVLGRFWQCNFEPVVCVYGPAGWEILVLVSNEIFWPSNEIHREVGRAKDLSAPR